MSNAGSPRRRTPSTGEGAPTHTNPTQPYERLGAFSYASVARRPWPFPIQGPLPRQGNTLQPTQNQVLGVEPSYRDPPAPWVVLRPGAVRRQGVAPSRVPSGPTIEPQSQYPRVSESVRLFVGPQTPGAAPLPEIIRGPRVAPAPTTYQTPRVEYPYGDNSAAQPVPRPGAIRALSITRSQRGLSGPGVAPQSQHLRVSEAGRLFVGTRAPWAAPLPEIVQGPRVAPGQITYQTPRVDSPYRGNSAVQPVPRAGAIRGLSIVPSQRGPPGPRVAPQSQYPEISRVIRSFVDTPAPWAAQPPGIVHGPRLNPPATSRQLPTAGPLNEDTPAPLNARRLGAMPAPNFPRSPIPNQRPNFLPHPVGLALWPDSPVRTPLGPRIEHRSTPEELSRGFPPVQTPSAPWAISASGPPFEPRIESPSTPRERPGDRVSRITPSTRHNMPSGLQHPGMTPLSPHVVSRPVQPLQPRPSTRHAAPTRVPLIETGPSTSELTPNRRIRVPPIETGPSTSELTPNRRIRVPLIETGPSRSELTRNRRIRVPLIETGPSTSELTPNRVLPFPTRPSTRPILSSGNQPLKPTSPQGAGSSVKETTAPMVAPLAKKGPSFQCDPLSSGVCTPQGGIDLLWTPEGITPAHPEWNFPARHMQKYYTGTFILAACKSKLPPNSNIRFKRKTKRRRRATPRSRRLDISKRSSSTVLAMSSTSWVMHRSWSSSLACRWRIFPPKGGRQKYFTARLLFTNSNTTMSAKRT